MKQTKMESFTEVLVGSALNIAAALIFNVTLLPVIIGMPVSFVLGAKVTASYTAISLLIRFAIRRYYNAKVQREVLRLPARVGSIQSLRRSGHMPRMSLDDYKDVVDGLPIYKSRRPNGQSTSRDGTAGRKENQKL